MNTSAPLIPGSGNFSAVEVTDYIFTELIVDSIQSDTITTQELVSGTINITSAGISGLLDPVLSQDVSTKNYVDTFSNAIISTLTEGCILLKGSANPFNQYSDLTFSNDLSTLEVPTINALQLNTNNLSITSTTNTNTISILQQTLPSSLNFILPVSYGLPGQIIRTDGSGNLSFDEQLTPDGPNYSLQYNNNGYGFTGSDNLKFQDGTLTVDANVISDFITATTLSTSSISNSSGFTLKATTTTSSAANFVFGQSGFISPTLLLESDGFDNISYVNYNLVTPSTITNAIQYYNSGLDASNNLLWSTSGLLISAGIDQISPGTSTTPTTVSIVYGIQNSRYSQVYQDYNYVIDKTNEVPTTLTVINIADPYETFIAARREINQINCIGISVVESKLFIFFTATEGSVEETQTPSSTLLIYDIINPSSPVLITTFEYSKNTRVFHVNESMTYIYIQTWEFLIDGTTGYLQIIDITNIYVPVIVSTYEFTQVGVALFNAITSLNNYVYMTTLVIDELFIFDVTPTTSIFFNSTLSSQTSFTSCSGTIRLFVEYPYLFNVTYDSIMGIVDVSDPTAPSVLTTYNLGFPQLVDAMYNNNYIFTVLAQSSQYAVIDWNGLISPTSTIYNSYLTYDLSASAAGSGQFLQRFVTNSTDNLCILGSDSINIFDESTLTSQVFLNDYSYINKPNQIIVDSYNTYISNVADNSITFLGPKPTYDQLYKLYFSRDVGFTVNQNTISFEIVGSTLFAISNYTFNIVELPRNPYENTTPPAISASLLLSNPLLSLSLSSNYAYVSSLNNIYKLNISSQNVSVYTSSVITVVNDINTTLIANNNLFVACDVSLRVYSLDLVLLQTLSFGGTSINLLSSNNYLYAYSANNLLQYSIINAPNANTILTTTTALGVSAVSMFMTGNNLYISLTNGSINTYNITSGSLIGSTTPGISSCLTVSGHLLYSPSPSNKLYIMNPYGMNINSCYVPNIKCSYVDIQSSALFNTLRCDDIVCDTLVTKQLTLTSKSSSSIANFGTTSITLSIPNNLTISDCTLAANAQASISVTVTGSSTELSRNITAVVNKHTGNGLPILVLQNRVVNTNIFNLIIYNRSSVTMTGVLIVSLFSS